MRIVADTNVIVSALVFGGVPRGVLEQAEAGRCDLFYSESIQREVRRVLEQKFGWDTIASCFFHWRLLHFGKLRVERTPLPLRTPKKFTAPL
jgi:hypothetical protein